MKIAKYINKVITENLHKQNFKEWFGDSVVIDNSGKPLIVYHGGSKFDVFNSPEHGDKGIYFTDNYYFALYFAIQNELSERDKRDDYKGVPDEMLDSGDWDEKYLKYSEVKRAYLKMENPTIVDAIDAKDIPKNYEVGKDGFIAKYTGDFGYKGGQFVVFNPNQVWIIR
jgi:hypothetical protein